MQHLSKRALEPQPAADCGAAWCRGRTEQRSTHFRLVAGSQITVRNGLGGKADFSYWQCYEALDGPIAQLDRVTDFYSVGCRFESCWDRQSIDRKGLIYKGFLDVRDFVQALIFRHRWVQMGTERCKTPKRVPKFLSLQSISMSHGLFCKSLETRVIL